MKFLIFFSILDRLPKANYNLLSHLVCVLHHIARRSKHNLMCASNLGVCCGPSLLWSVNPSVKHSRTIPTLTEMLIRHCEVLFGEGVTQLLGEERSDSGAEESTDSLHCEFAKSFYAIPLPIFLVKKNLSDADLYKRSIETFIRAVAAGGLSLDSLDLTEPPRKDHMSLSRDSGLTLSDCQLFIPESPVGSEDSAVNATSSSFDKTLIKDDKSTNKNYVRVYGGWEERINGYAATHLQNAIDTFHDKGVAGYPNPNFQRQDWLRAQLKRTPRTKLDEHEQRKERFDEKDVYAREYQELKDNLDNRKELVYRSSQMDVSRDVRETSERVSLHGSEPEPADSPLPTDRYEFNKEHFSEFKKVKSEIYVNRESPISQSGSYHSSGDIYEFKKVKSEIYINNETRTDRYEYDKSDNIYGNHQNPNDIYDTRERGEMYTFKPSDAINYGEEDVDSRRTWPDTPPPLPPRLRHLPPVHMNLEDRHKVAGRSRSLPPPPPYRPPPQPRAPITTRHLGYGRSVIDDESYV